MARCTALGAASSTGPKARLTERSHCSARSAGFFGLTTHGTARGEIDDTVLGSSVMTFKVQWGSKASKRLMATTNMARSPTLE